MSNQASPVSRATCDRLKTYFEAGIVQLLEALDKPKAALSLKETILLQAQEISMLLCDELGPDAEYEDVNLLLIYEKVKDIFDGVRRILVDRAKRRQGRGQRT